MRSKSYISKRNKPYLPLDRVIFHYPSALCLNIVNYMPELLPQRCNDPMAIALMAARARSKSIAYVLGEALNGGHGQDGSCGMNGHSGRPGISGTCQ
jgi:hypothetical protein